MPRPKTPDLDLNNLFEISVEQPKMTKKASSSRLKYSENKDRFERAGFDLFRDKQSEFIWKLEKDSETGEEFIIRTATVDPLYKQAPNWSTETDANKNAIHLLYKGHAVTAFKKADLNYGDEDVEEWRRFLLDKISTDPRFLKQVVQQLSVEKKRLLASKCPELFK